MYEIRFKRIWGHDLPLPYYQTSGSAGFDLRSSIDYILKPNETYKIPTGFSLAIPLGYEGQVRSRSGLGVNHGVIVAHSVGTVDSDYRDELLVPLWNRSLVDFKIEKGMRVAQMVIAEARQFSIIEVDVLERTNRVGGYGSTGLV